MRNTLDKNPPLVTAPVRLNPSTHLHYQVSDQINFHGAVSRSVNRPKFDELAPFTNEQNNRFVIGNPELEPAHSVNYDVGISHIDDNTLFAINLFHKGIKGVTEEVDTGQEINGKDVFRIDNVGDGWTRGIELEQRVQMGVLHSRLKGLTLWGNESLLDSQLKVKNGIKRPFNEQPTVITNSGVEYVSAATGTSINLIAKYRDQITKLKVEGEKEGYVAVIC